jgi:translation initiation factor 3 subunit C
MINSINVPGLLPFRRRIQEQGLRTYLFTYAPHYSTLSVSLLSRTFSLPLRTVTSIVSKMIWSEELSASLDQSGGVIVFHRIELSRTQQAAQVVAEKISAMVEQSEKTLDNKMGNVSGWGERADGAKGDKRGEQAQGHDRGRGERTRGTRGEFICLVYCDCV